MESPPDFTIDDAGVTRPLRAEDVTRDKYLHLAARYRAVGVRPAPETKTKVLLAVNL